jgi:hypothetical protein
MAKGAGRGCFVVVPSCLLETVQDCCEWHAYGTPIEDDVGYRSRRWLDPYPRVRSVLGAYRLVGKSPEGSRQVGTQGPGKLRFVLGCPMALRRGPAPRDRVSRLGARLQRQACSGIWCRPCRGTAHCPDQRRRIPVILQGISCSGLIS